MIRYDERLSDMKVHYAKLWFSLAVLPLPGFTAFADWSWSGKTGSVTIPPDTTAVVTDSDVDTVAALTAIKLEAGATLSFNNTANRCVVSAALSGDGALNTGDGAPVTFAA